MSKLDCRCIGMFTQLPMNNFKRLYIMELDIISIR